MFFSLSRLKFWLIVGLTVGLICIASLSDAQTSSPITGTPSTSNTVKDISELFPSLSRLADFSGMPTTEWIWLDGRRLFQVTALENYLPERVQKIETNLKQISSAYFQSSNDNLQVNVTTINGSPIIEIDSQYLLTVTDLDAKLRGIDPSTWAEQLSQILQQALVRAKQERRSQFLLRQGAIACGILLAVGIVKLA